MKAAGANMKYIASASGLTAKIQAQKGNISKATSDYREILNDPEVDTVMITTRHNLHAKMVIEALQASKNVFVEKPLCLNETELQQIIDSKLANQNSQLVVGFNRRFAPLAQKMKQLLGEGPKNIVATMNAGFIPANMWVHDPEVGGGRIIGEACHYIDLCTFLTESKVKAVCMNSMGTNPGENTDNASILLKYENGSNAVINYFANGSKAYSKERIEAYAQEKTLIIDNWRILKGYGTKGFSKMKTRLDKGHKGQFRLLVQSIKTGQPIIPFDEIINTTQASFAAIQSLKEGKWIAI
jgi:predicted dehydrogenase